MEAKWRQESKELLENPIKWVYYPFLPVKRYCKDTKQVECCFVVAAKVTIVFLENFFIMCSRAKEKGVTMRDILGGLEKLEYKTVDEMLDDGWEVD